MLISCISTTIQEKLGTNLASPRKDPVILELLPVPAISHKSNVDHGSLTWTVSMLRYLFHNAQYDRRSKDLKPLWVSNELCGPDEILTVSSSLKCGIDGLMHVSSVHSSLLIRVRNPLWFTGGPVPSCSLPALALLHSTNHNANVHCGERFVVPKESQSYHLRHTLDQHLESRRKQRCPCLCKSRYIH